ncbi:MAG: hypothetical protein CMP11_08205 [Zetaproteobacteria bacterium]|nr:hypothetical protein [Pseudobdellovibrionaceae bacterium]
MAEKIKFDKKVKRLHVISILKNQLHQKHVENIALKSLKPQPSRFEEKSYFPLIARIDFYKEDEAISCLEKWVKEKKIIFFEENKTSKIPTHLPAEEEKASKDKKLRQEEVPSWWHKLSKIQEAHSLPQISELLQLSNSKFPLKKPPVIAVMDSGVDYTHPAIKKNIWQNPHPGENLCGYDKNGCNTTITSFHQLGDGNVYPYGTKSAGQSCPSSSTINKNIDSNCSHGTQLAGIIASTKKNELLGACPICKILIVKVIHSVEGQAQITDSAILNGLKYLSIIKEKQDINLRIINASFGKFEKSKTIEVFLEQLNTGQPKGLLMIAAAGNENTSKPVYPAAHNSTISVTALDHNSKKSYYANFGTWVNIAAPGGGAYNKLNQYFGIRSSVPGHYWTTGQGSSLAVPLVSSVAGLILSLDPEIPNSKLKKIILSTADQSIYKNCLEKKDICFSYDKNQNKIELLGTGVVNAKKALQAVLKKDIVYKPIIKTRINPQCGSLSLLFKTKRLYDKLLYYLLFLVYPVLLIFFSWRKGKLSCIKRLRYLRVFHNI